MLRYHNRVNLSQQSVRYFVPGCKNIFQTYPQFSTICLNNTNSTLSTHKTVNTLFKSKIQILLLLRVTIICIQKIAYYVHKPIHQKKAKIISYTMLLRKCIQEVPDGTYATLEVYCQILSKKVKICDNSANTSAKYTFSTVLERSYRSLSSIL